MYKCLSNEGLSVQTAVADGICRIFLCSLVDIPAAEYAKAFVIFLGLTSPNEFSLSKYQYRKQ
jgi:hypothetical protein